MKRLFQWMLAAILICGATTFTSCTNEDNPATPDLNVAEKILGKWIETDINGQPAATNAKRVYTFVSTTKAYLSASLTMRPEYGACWSDQVEATVAIDGNKVILNVHHNEHKSAVHEFTVTVINESEFTAIRKLTITVDGSVVLNDESTIRFVKQTTDYRETVLGLWECTGLTGGETFNDANARLEFLADGTYRYYRMDDNNDWQTVTNREFQDYFVDGALLATRWKNQGEDELREWWEIESLNGNEMVWTALRQNADGSTFQQKMTWKKIDLKVSEKIIGKWMAVEWDGQPTLTNYKAVYNFISSTKAYITASFNKRSETTLWGSQINDVAISGNKVTLTSHPNDHSTVVEEMTFTAINDTEFTANRKMTWTTNGNVELTLEGTVRLVKVSADYSDAIVGTWEGRCTSEGSVFDDGQEHRWQYKADGTYVYYVKDGDDWVASDNTLNEYFVDGTLLCTRWVDNEQENREWWEINIDGDKMNWTALRQKEDGSTFTATFEMKKVQ